jgi:N,N-dimethylformamidase beta subunit-like, C-terminal/NHL repeat
MRFWFVAVFVVGCAPPAAQIHKPQPTTDGDVDATDGGASDGGGDDGPTQLPPRPSPIAAENQQAGDPGWRLTAPTAGLAAYTDHQSYAPGDVATIHAAAPAATTATWELWRLGYYGGAGGRLVAQGGPVAVPRAAPAVMDPTTGAVSAPWPPTFTVALDPAAVTGVYVVKLVAPAAQTYALVVVREAAPGAPIVYPVAVNTYQAYNAWGGTSLYDNARPDWPDWHAYAVSFDRPYAQDEGTGQFLYVDRHFVTFLEAQGYDVAYATDTDLDADATLLAGRRLAAIQGHSEYWTAPMRDHVEAAIAARTNVAFFGANDVYWQVRYAPDHRTLVGYKEFASKDPLAATDPAHVTTRWRDLPVGRPENALVGPMFGAWLIAAAPLTPDDATHWLWTGSGMTDGAMVPGLFGFEIDTRYANGFEPAGLDELAGALVEDHSGHYARASTTLYTAPSGAQVFATGTVTWAAALAGPGAWDARVQAATANLFARFAGDGALPAVVAPMTLPPGPQPYAYRAGVQVATVTTALTNPTAVAAAPSGDAIVVDGDRVVRVASGGAITLVAGAAAGDADGTGAAAAFRAPRGIAVAADGTIYVADTGNHKIKKIAAGGVTTTLAGSIEGYAEGTGAAARFDTPMSVALLPSGTLLVADLWNNRLRAISPGCATSTWVGTGVRGVLDGPGAQAQIYFAVALAARPDGSVVWPEAETGLVRVMAPDAAHTVSTLAGELGRLGWADGPVATAQVSELISLAARGGDLVLLDTAAYRVRMLSSSGQVDTLAGGARHDLFDGAGAQAGFDLPRAAAAAPDGSIVIVDSGNHALRRLTLP